MVEVKFSIICILTRENQSLYKRKEKDLLQSQFNTKGIFKVDFLISVRIIKIERTFLGVTTWFSLRT